MKTSSKLAVHFNGQQQENQYPSKVVCVSLNPALDLTGWLPQLHVGHVNQIDQSDFHPAGKGVNVAKVLSDLGASVTLTGFLGADNQRPFCDLFEQYHINDQFVRIEHAMTRINVKLVETVGLEQDRVSDVNFPGFVVTPHHIEQLENKLLGLTKQCDLFIFTGSLPQNIPTTIYAQWIKLLHKQGCKVILDSSKQPLIEGIAANPWMIKPNEEELRQWAQSVGEQQRDPKKLGLKLQQHGIANVVVSQGAHGLFLYNNKNLFLAKPPTMKVISTVGAGDTLVAGLCWGYLQQWTTEQTLQFATALSAYAVTQKGVGASDLEEIQHIINNTHVTTLSKDKEV